MAGMTYIWTSLGQFKPSRLTCRLTEKEPELDLTMRNDLEKSCLQSNNPCYSGYQFAAYADGRNVQGQGGFTDITSEKRVTSATLFDLASLTKLFTASVAARLAASGILDLDAPIADWSGLQLHSTQRALTSRELLTHTSGLPAEWIEKDSREATVDSLLETPSMPGGVGKQVYACTGYSLFAIALEKWSSKSIADWVRELITSPLELDSIGYNPDKTAEIAASGNPEQGLPAGVVHDPRARALDGVSGNAGLFGNSGDLLKFAIEVGFGTYGIFEDEARKLLSTPTSKGEWSQAIGFRFSDSARIGHNRNWLSHSGFTGTLMAIDPDGEKAGVLLTNRLTLGTSREGIAAVYRSFCDSLSSGELD